MTTVTVFLGTAVLFTIYLPLQELGLIRKPASFMTSICDERGQELLYAGIPITDIFKEDMGIGGVLSLLWFQRRYWIQGTFCTFLCRLRSITAHGDHFVLGLSFRLSVCLVVTLSW